MDIRFLDAQRDSCWERFFIKICKLDYWKYRANRSILDRELLEGHLDKIIQDMFKFIIVLRFNSEAAPDWIIDLDHIYVGFQILGVLILQSGAILPEIVRFAVLHSTTWEYDGQRGWSKLLIEKRKENLRKFRSVIENHKTGKPIKIDF